MTPRGCTMRIDFGRAKVTILGRAQCSDQHPVWRFPHGVLVPVIDDVGGVGLDQFPHLVSQHICSRYGQGSSDGLPLVGHYLGGKPR